MQSLEPGAGAQSRAAPGAAEERFCAVQAEPLREMMSLTKEPGGSYAKRRVDETGHVQRSAAVGIGRSDIHGFGVNALVGSFPLLKTSVVQGQRLAQSRRVVHTQHRFSIQSQPQRYSIPLQPWKSGHSWPRSIDKIDKASFSSKRPGAHFSPVCGKWEFRSPLRRKLTPESCFH